MKKMISVRLFIFFALGIGVLTVAAQDVPKMIKGGIVNGKAVSLPQPVYSAEAKAAGLEGTVLVDVVIDEAGAVVSALAATDTRKMSAPGKDPDQVEISPADPILREAAEKAALEAKFAPTQLSGVPVKISGTLVYVFALGNSAHWPEPSRSVSGGILNAKAINMPAPAYPASARAVKASGTVNVQVVIDETGEITSASAVSGHPLLRAAAVEAAKAAKFAPTMLSGEPVKVSGILTYNFVLNEDSN